MLALHRDRDRRGDAPSCSGGKPPPVGYFSGSSLTTAMRFTPSACELLRDHRHVERPVHRLAAGHRDGVVVEDLVGDVDVGGDAGADRQEARVVVGAVAEVLEHVRSSCVNGAWPIQVAPSPPIWVKVSVLRSIHCDHVVAADAGERAAALGHLGRAVVRAARAEIGDALDRRLVAGERLLLGVEEGEPLRDPLAGVEARDALGDHAGDARRRQLVGRGQDPVALLVELADHLRAHVLASSCRAAPSAGSRSARASPRRRGSPRAPRRTARTPSRSSGQVMPIL